ncbi:MAG: hypothetical protein AB7I41_20760 [Candidatus Sericytochromatia bacterium]
MALKPCLKCGHEISEIAEVCPKCKTKTGELDASFMNAALDASRLSVPTEEMAQDISLHLAPASPPETKTERRTSQQKNGKNHPQQVHNYHPHIIEQFASELYDNADKLIFMSVWKYGLLCGVVGFFIGFFPFLGDGPKWLFAVIGGILGAVFGYSSAQPKALEIKFQAQMARCILQIEFNTRDRS